MKSFKQIVYEGLIVGIASPAILAGHAMIATGTAITTGGHITKGAGEGTKAVLTMKSQVAQQQAIEAKRAAEARKDAAKLARHQRKMELLERELQKERETFRAGGMVMEAEIC